MKQIANNTILRLFRNLFNLSNYIKTKKDFLGMLMVHLLSMAILALFILIGIFYSVLPIYTRYNKWIMVPNLNGMPIKEAQEFLKNKQLKYSIKAKQTYSSEYPANVILFQNPAAGSKVKKNRTIYVSLNSDTPPLIEMPNLLHGSVRNAQVILKNNDLKLGYVQYVSNIAKNTILKQFYNNKVINAGELIPKGAKVDLVVGTGLGKMEIIMPNLLGETLSEAEDTLKIYGLQIGSVIYSNNIENAPKPSYKEDKDLPVNSSDKEADLGLEKETQTQTEPKHESCAVNTIFKQIPTSSKLVKHGSVVDIWIYKPNN